MMVREYRHVLAAMLTAGCWVRGMEEKRERSPGERKRKKGKRKNDEDDGLPEGEVTERQRTSSIGPRKGEGDGEEENSARGWEQGGMGGGDIVRRCCVVAKHAACAFVGQTET
jgi:hypothetical protein